MKKLNLLFLIVVLLVQTACFSNKDSDKEAVNQTLQKRATTYSAVDLQVYFAPFDNIEEKVLKVLDEAKTEVLIAHYNIRSQRILEKIVSLKKKGIVIKVAADKENALKTWNTGDDYMESNGIPVVRTKPTSEYAIMHLKVCVIDRKTIMTGSYNWNETAELSNDENMMIIRNEAVAKIYGNQVLEVFGEKPHVIEGGVITPDVEAHFSPEENLGKIIETQINNAKESVDISMFTFTQKYIQSSLINAALRGVKVRVILEDKQCDLTTVDEELSTKQGITLYKVANKLAEHSAMHQKYCIIDGKTVISGSANWTMSGTRYSDEDIIIIRNPEVAKKYMQNYYDQLYIYTAKDESFSGETIRNNLPILFRGMNIKTSVGDRVFVVGNTAELGNWNLSSALEMTTSDGMYPNWYAKSVVGTEKTLEYKFVILRRSGATEWENGSNRKLALSKNGRAVVISGEYGDTSKNFKPKEATEPVVLQKTYSQVYLRGTLNNWSTEPMLLVDNNIWKTVVTFGTEANQRFKFDIYGDWKLNFGDNNSDFIADAGANKDIFVNAGKYTITFNDKTNAYKVVKE